MASRARRNDFRGHKESPEDGFEDTRGWLGCFIFFGGFIGVILLIVIAVILAFIEVLK